MDVVDESAEVEPDVRKVCLVNFISHSKGGLKGAFRVFNIEMILSL